MYLTKFSVTWLYACLRLTELHCQHLYMQKPWTPSEAATLWHREQDRFLAMKF